MHIQMNIIMSRKTLDEQRSRLLSKYFRHKPFSTVNKFTYILSANSQVVEKSFKNERACRDGIAKK